MKKILVPFFIFMAIFPVHSQISMQDGFKQDLEYYAKTLPQKHINPFFKISKEEFESEIDLIKSKIDSLDEDAFLNELFKLTEAIGDEHTRVEPKEMHHFNLPLQFGSFKEGIFVMETDSIHSGLLLAQLLTVNDVPVDEVMDKLKTIIVHDNLSYFNSLALYYLSNSFILNGLNVTDSKEEVIYTFENTEGKIVKVAFHLSCTGKMLKARQPAHPEKRSGTDHYWYTCLPVYRSVYFNYTNCKNDTKFPFEKFVLELFDSIAINKPEKIVVDLRENGGGNSMVLEPFLQKIKNNDLNKEGCFYVLIGKMTFSSALLNAINLKRNFNTILIGESTAGNINHYGEIRVFELPFTRAKVIYSTQYFEEWKGKNGPLYPDVEIEYSIENFKNGQDEALEYIFRQELTMRQME